MKPLIFLIAAVDQHGVIGVDNQLPWHLPDDLRHFRTLTAGKPVIMGRKTYDSIGRPLPNRLNIVMTRDPDFSATGTTIVHSREEALKAAGDAAEVAVIGGGHIFEEFLPLAQRIYLTQVTTIVQGSAFFPRLQTSQWQELERTHHPADLNHQFAFDFVTLERMPATLPHHRKPATVV